MTPAPTDKVLASAELFQSSDDGTANLVSAASRLTHGRAGTFDIEGNRRFSREELQILYPFGPVGPSGTPVGGARPFSRSEWDGDTIAERARKLHAGRTAADHDDVEFTGLQGLEM